jgi:hypothetical protein
MTVKEWVETAITLVALGGSLYFFRSVFGKWANGIYTRLDELIETTKNMAINDARQDEKISNLGKKIDGVQGRLDERLSTHEQRLNKHSDRIRGVENKTNKCKNYQE